MFPLPGGGSLAALPPTIAQRGRQLGPGFGLALVVGLAAAWIGDHHGGPVLLFALLIGMAFNFLSDDARFRAGIAFTSRTVLRLGVALLGARITLEQILSLGVVPSLAVVLAVVGTLLFGRFLARRLGLGEEQGILTGGATAICGASAALAISSVMPKRAELERNTVYAVVAVTTLSTCAMVLYPALVALVGFDETTGGVLIGATIHDVAQVVAAGYTISDTAGDTATFTKMMRVAMLVPVVFLLSLYFKPRRLALGEAAQGRLIGLPLFLVAFVVLVGINSLGFLPASLAQPMIDTSRWCLVLAVAALGMKTSLKEMTQLGWKPFILVVSETLFLLVAVLGFLLLASDL
ncbi:YeiH family protein [Aquibaculum arenosum]|uniref:Sulfate exporter family transporter n=1 Tax=Aquibaculum arenosum TaxID=3032591 RepID=A0ABT5YPI2_9PROT|nr:putative sulfate exporter family transporter [Fodinicurvata sp. CAU 1616]MDF2096871.1 putative sulfate exporter family transporter [Fodinicurvata sp. CAU 1616]